MKQYCNFGNHTFEDGTPPEPIDKHMTQEELIEVLSHSTGHIACRECWSEFEKRTNDI